jgi:hypothetical protein
MNEVLNLNVFGETPVEYRRACRVPCRNFPDESLLGRWQLNYRAHERAVRDSVSPSEVIAEKTGAAHFRMELRREGVVHCVDPDVFEQFGLVNATLR